MLSVSLVLLTALSHVHAQSSAALCPSTLAPANGVHPLVAPGYTWSLVATGLTDPRSIAFDTQGHLLVVEAGKGISIHSITGDETGPCLSFNQSNMLVNDTNLNHGIALSEDGKTLWTSSSEALFEFTYDAVAQSVGTTNITLVTNMTNDDHTTRTLLSPSFVQDLIVISRGSTSNIDTLAEDITSGHSQIRAFNISQIKASGMPAEFSTNGTLLGWGLRNSVGVAEYPLTGGIFSVENSVDNIQRDGQDIHEDNPGEEMNFHGYLNGTAYAAQGSNYGYPYCYAAWQPSDIPENQGLVVGSQFALGTPNATVNDTYCSADTTSPRLTFQAHMAPLDIKFNNSGIDCWITFHGSWDRTDPVGYKVSVVEFDPLAGQPVAQSTSQTSASDIFYNANNSVCPDNCFRPVGLAFDQKGRMFVSSDATGEVYVIVRTDATAAENSDTGNGTSTMTSSGAMPSSTGAATGTAPSASTSGQSWAVKGAQLDLFVLLGSLAFATFTLLSN